MVHLADDFAICEEGEKMRLDATETASFEF